MSTSPRPSATLIVSLSEGQDMTFAIPVQKLPLPQVAAITGLPEPIVRHLVDAGVLAGDASTADLEDAQLLAGVLAEARASVSEPILVSAAAKKYQFGRGTIYNWIRDGWVKVLIEEPRVKVAEGDIAYARKLADIVGQLPGRAVFPAKPRPGRPRKRNADDN